MGCASSKQVDGAISVYRPSPTSFAVFDINSIEEPWFNKATTEAHLDNNEKVQQDEEPTKFPKPILDKLKTLELEPTPQSWEELSKTLEDLKKPEARSAPPKKLDASATSLPASDVSFKTAPRKSFSFHTLEELDAKLTPSEQKPRCPLPPKYFSFTPTSTMGYNRLDHPPAPPTPPSTSKTLLIFSTLFAATLIIASAVCAAVLLTSSAKHNKNLHRQPTQAISRTCSKTRYPSLCINTLLNFPKASEQELVHISFNITLQHLNSALYSTSEIGFMSMDTFSRAAFEDCKELLLESVDALSRSLTSSGSIHDVLTWLSAALTNQDTCMEGLESSNGEVKEIMSEKLKDLSELVSNCLAIYSANESGDFSGLPVKNKRRLMDDYDGLPKWLSVRERELLSMHVFAIQLHADIVVSKNGNGTYRTIAEAIKKAPEYSSKRTIIYVKEGRYEENNLKVGMKKWNLMFIGDGKGKTVITGGKSISDNITTFHTASFAASGQGFIARDITFENYAGPAKHQAVALRVSADHGVVYQCNIIGYQDALYVHSNRQFYRECGIYGTVDFIFGNAAVVLQKCSIYARKPMPLQKNTITAQNRKDPNQNTGISIHDCRLYATSDLESSKRSYPTYLGRPWKLYSRVVYMLTFMGDHIHPKGWLEWNTTFALDTLYYGEYMNFGPGAALGQRVKWPGYRVITSALEANKFTVGKYISGSSWLPSTGVAFLAGLSV